VKGEHEFLSEKESQRESRKLSWESTRGNPIWGKKNYQSSFLFGAECKVSIHLLPFSLLIKVQSQLKVRIFNN